LALPGSKRSPPTNCRAGRGLYRWVARPARRRRIRSPDWPTVSLFGRPAPDRAPPRFVAPLARLICDATLICDAAFSVTRGLAMGTGTSAATFIAGATVLSRSTLGLSAAGHGCRDQCLVPQNRHSRGRIGMFPLGFSQIFWGPLFQNLSFSSIDLNIRHHFVWSDYLPLSPLNFTSV
jgi:hypothetical protein